MRRTGLLILGSLLLSCSSEPTTTGTLLPAEETPWRTDRDSYTLGYQQGAYLTTARVSYTNRTGIAVYLHRACGHGSEPSRYLERVDGSTEQVRLFAGAQLCITAPLSRPIRVEAGATFIDEFMLSGSESPRANPPFTMAMRTGKFRLIYDVQRTDRVEGWDPVDLLPREYRESNSFTVLPPE